MKATRNSGHRIRQFSWRIVMVFSILISCISKTMASAPTFITIGAVFGSFDVGPTLHLRRNFIGSQHVAAFMLAIDQVNNKTDGVLDYLLPNTRLEVATSFGQDMVIEYPQNGYLDGSNAAYNIKESSSNLKAVIGGSSYYSTLTSSLTFNAWGLPFVITESPSTEFSHVDRFPMVLRMPPSESYAVYAFFDVLKHYGWKKVSIFYTNDDMGTDCFHNFIRKSTPQFLMDLDRSGQSSRSSLEDFTIDVLSHHSFLPHATNIDVHIDEAKATGARIFLLFMDSQSAARVLYSGYKRGLFEDGTQVIGSDISLLNRLEEVKTQSLNDVWKYVKSFDNSIDVSEVMKGYMSLTADPSLYFSTSRGRTFINHFRSLDPTITYNTSGYSFCDSSQDNTTLNSYLYQARWRYSNLCGCSSVHSHDTSQWTVESSEVVCTGIESFQDFSENGTDIHPNILYTYDAVMVLAEAMHSLISEDLDVNGTSLYRRLTNGVHELSASATGRTLFFSGVPEENYFSRGDRISDHFYGLEMFDYGAKYNSFISIGSWNTSHGLTMCNNNNNNNNNGIHSDYWRCDNPVFRSSGDTSIPPKDMRDPRIVHLDIAYQYVLIAISSLLLIVSIVIAAFIAYNWTDKVIRSSQPHMLFLMILGCIMACIKVLMVGLSKVDFHRCEEDLWLSHLAFLFLLSPLVLKLWRVDRICNNTSIKRVKITEHTVMKYFAVNVSIAVVILSLLSGLGGSRVKVLTSLHANQYTEEYYCGSSVTFAGHVLEIILWLYQSMNILLAVYYTYLCRNVPTVVNETAQIAPAVVGMVVVVVVVTALVLSVDMKYDSSLFLINIMFAACVYGSCVFYWFPKIKKTYEHAKSHKEHENDVVKFSNTGVANTRVKGGFTNNNNGMDNNNNNNNNMDREDRKLKRKEDAMTFEQVKVQCRQISDRISTLSLHKDEKAMFCQQQIDQWKAMLLLIAESDDSSGNNSDSVSSAASVTVTATGVTGNSRVVPADSSGHQGSEVLVISNDVTEPEAGQPN